MIKPGTERNEMERNETKRNGKERQKSGVWCSEIEDRARSVRLGGLQADKQDTECTLAGLNPMLRVSGLHPMLRQRDPAARLIVCFC